MCCHSSYVYDEVNNAIRLALLFHFYFILFYFICSKRDCRLILNFN